MEEQLKQLVSSTWCSFISSFFFFVFDFFASVHDSQARQWPVECSQGKHWREWGELATSWQIGLQARDAVSRGGLDGHPSEMFQFDFWSQQMILFDNLNWHITNIISWASWSEWAICHSQVLLLKVGWSAWLHISHWNVLRRITENTDKVGLFQT